VITIQLKGGLGNQMFQYALAKQLSQKTGQPIRFDLVFLQSRLPGRKYVFRDYDLDIFGIKEPTTFLSKSPKFLRNATYLTQKFFQLFWKKINNQFYEEKAPYLFDEKALRLTGNVYLVGYWQNEFYFKQIEDEIRKIFSSFKKPLSPKSEKLLEEIRSTSSVCVNFRRTDYLSQPENQDFFGIPATSYYRRAIAHIRERVKDLQLFVFSDDIDWCKDNFRSDLPITFVGHEYAGEKFADYLRLMTACQHQIIPNSTFAWWAAWLNTNPNKIVIAPIPWSNGNRQEVEGLIPKTWIQIPKN